LFLFAKEYNISLEVISKIRFWFKIKAAECFNPQEYLKYFEELKREANTDIGPKELFEMTSTQTERLLRLPELQGRCHFAIVDYAGWHLTL
jgi:hypothetical protein